MAAPRDEQARRRAEARRRRRDAGHEQASTSRDPQVEADVRADSRQMVRDAATHALAAATVGAVRALAARATAPEREPDELDDEPDPEPELAPAGVAPAADDSESEDRHDREGRREPRERHEPRRAQSGEDRSTVRQLLRAAREQFEELHGSAPESVSGVARSPDGWSITFEVVELRRVPESTDVLGSYRVELDEDGNFVTYERTRRYYRSQAGEGDGSR